MGRTVRIHPGTEKLQQSPLQSAMPVQSVIWKLDPDVPVSNVLTMDQVVSRNTLNASFDASLLSAFAGLSLLLAGESCLASCLTSLHSVLAR